MFDDLNSLSHCHATLPVQRCKICQRQQSPVPENRARNSGLLMYPDRGRGGGREDEGMNGGQEKECGQCRGRERQTTGAGWIGVVGRGGRRRYVLPERQGSGIRSWDVHTNAFARTHTNTQTHNGTVKQPRRKLSDFDRFLQHVLSLIAAVQSQIAQSSYQYSIVYTAWL